MARLAALQWDTYVRLDAAEYWGAEALAENRRLDEQRAAAVAEAEALRQERDRLQAEHDRIQAERDRLQAERDRSESEREALLSTRRYRLAQGLARPLDLVRARRRSR
jgi:predicted nuclease with TOPRIM domain